MCFDYDTMYFAENYDYLREHDMCSGKAELCATVTMNAKIVAFYVVPRKFLLPGKYNAQRFKDMRHYSLVSDPFFAVFLALFPVDQWYPRWERLCFVKTCHLAQRGQAYNSWWRCDTEYAHFMLRYVANKLKRRGTLAIQEVLREVCWTRCITLLKLVKLFSLNGFYVDDEWVYVSLTDDSANDDPPPDVGIIGDVLKGDRVRKRA